MAEVVNIASLPPALIARLEREFGAVNIPRGPERDQFFAEHADEVRVLICSYQDGATAEVLAQLPHLEAVCNLGVGYDSTDVAYLRERGIPLANTPDVLTECVADIAVGLLIDTMRQLTASDRFLRAGRWARGEAYPLTRRVWGTPVGILGLGRIGQAIARRLEAFGCPISYYSRHEVTDVNYTYCDSPVALATSCRALVVAVPGGVETDGLVNAEVLKALGPDGFVVNIARGSVIDEAALIAALETGEIAGAGLDVFRNEPNVPAALLGRNDVVLLPHVGSGSVETRTDMADLLIDNIAAWLTRRELVTPV